MFVKQRQTNNARTIKDNFRDNKIYLFIFLSIKTFTKENMSNLKFLLLNYRLYNNNKKSKLKKRKILFILNNNKKDYLIKYF